MNKVNILIVTALTIIMALSGLTAGLLTTTFILSSSGTITETTTVYKTVKTGIFAYGTGFTTSDADFISDHFSIIDLNFEVSGIATIKNRNPNVTVIGYKDLIGMHTHYSDWPEVNAHEDWFIHDIYGNRIQNSAWGWYLMDVGNSGWREHWVNNLNSNMGSLFDGVFVDDVWNSLNGYVSGVSSSVYNNWHSNVLGMLQYIKANITPGKLVIINTDEWNSYTYVSVVDGQMLEGFVHCDWEACNTQGTRNAALILAQINNMAINSAAGKIVWGASGTLVPSDSNDMARMVKYCYAGFLLGQNGDGAIWQFNGWHSSDGSHGYYPIMDTPIGNPTNSYYQSQNVYMRDYTNGKAIFNPSGNTYTINLGGTYKTLDDREVTSITVGAYSGEVLLLSSNGSAEPSPDTSLSSTNIFGVTSVGSIKIGTGGVAAKTGAYLPLNTEANITKISAYISGSGSAKCAIYSDAEGNPGSAIGAVTNQMPVPNSPNWVEFTYNTPVPLSAGNYWLVLIYNGDCNWYYENGGTSAWNYITYEYEPNSNFGTHTDRTDLISIYATYTTSNP